MGYFSPCQKNGEKSGSARNEIGVGMQAICTELQAFNVVKGFLNLQLADAFWINEFKSIANQQDFGIQPQDSKDRIIVEYSSPNTNKPLHLGHLRNNFLGYSIAELLKANGHKVTKVQIINDRGIHICKSMVAWLQFGNSETPESSGLKGDKLVGKYYVAYDKQFKSEVESLVNSGLTKEEAEQQSPIATAAREMLLKWEEKNAEVLELWRKMNAWVYEGFDHTYKAMGVDFDKLYYESDTYLLGKDWVMKGLESKVFFQKEDGSIWVDLTDEGLDQKALLRKDGTAMYITQDIGTAMLRFQDYPDTSYQIYTVGNEQDYHFKVLFKVLKKLGVEQAEKCFHLSYGMVELPEGKMKSREGTVVDADDLMQEMQAVAKQVADEQGKLEGLSAEEKAELHQIIGMSALKYFLLRVDPKKNMLFDPKESIDFNGNTGPFIQYGYVRTQAILRKVDFDYGHSVPDSLSQEERNLIQTVLNFPQVLTEAQQGYNASLVAGYAYDLVRDFNSFYQSSPILREPNDNQKSFRLQLTFQVGAIVKNAMRILGIQMPQRM